jgi:hypothetical protein
MKTFSHLWQYLAELFLEWENVSIKGVDKIKTRALYSFSPKIVPFMRLCRIMWWSPKGHGWQYNKAHALCIMDKYGYTRMHTQVPICPRGPEHTHTETCNIHCFFTAISSRMHLIVTLYCLFCYILRALYFFCKVFVFENIYNLSWSYFCFLILQHLLNISTPFHYKVYKCPVHC